MRGLDLKVGGEGMKAFYDQMLPKALEKLAKKHDPEARVGQHSLGAVGDIYGARDPNTGRGKRKVVQAHSLDITPKMRASILKGQTAYATGGSVPEPQSVFPPSDVPGLDTARQALVPKRTTVQEDPTASHAELSRLLDKTRGTQIGKMVDQYQKPAVGTAVKRIHGDLKGLAQEGEPGRMWYEKSSKRLLDYVGGNKDEAHKLAQLIAIYSPQTGVPTSTPRTPSRPTIACQDRARRCGPATFIDQGQELRHDQGRQRLRARPWAKQHPGGSGGNAGSRITKVPLDDSGKRFLFARHNMGGYENIATADRDLKAHLLMNHGIPFEGRKTNNFYRNLMTHIDPKMDQGSTQDLWMARAFGFHDDAVSNANKYDFMEKLTHKLGHELGWKPHQVQAAIWTAMKTRQEAVKSDVMKEAVDHGIGKMVNDPETGKPNFEVEPGKEHLYNSLMRKHALGAVLDPGHIQRSARDFSDFLDANLAHVSWEATPSKQIQHLQGLEQKPPEVKADYHKRISEALQDEHGHDLLAKYLNVLSPGTVEAPGYWKGNVNPASHLQVAATRIKAAGQRPDIDAASKELMDHYANARGLLLKQDAVGYHRPFYNSQVTNANGVEYQFDKDLTGEQIRKLGDTMDEHLPGTAVVPSGPRTVRVLHFGDYDEKTDKMVPRKDYRPHHKAVDEVLKKSGLSDTLTAEKRLFASDGDLRGNDWKKHPHGEDYTRRLGAAGRSDVLRYISDVLAPKVQAVDEAFAKEHGLKRDARLEASLRRPPAEEVEKPVAKATGGVVDRTPAEEHMLEQSGDLGPSKSVPADDELIEKALALAQSDRKGHKNGGAVVEEASVVADIKSDLDKLTTVITAQNAQIDKLTRLLSAPQLVERDENNRIKKIYRELPQ